MMVDIFLSRERALLIIAALEAVYQLDGLSFSEAQRELALELQQEMEERLDEYDELDFNDE